MELFENWSQSRDALLEGLSDKMRDNVAICLENQRSEILRESAADGSVGATNIAGFRKILMPIIRLSRWHVIAVLS